MNMPIQVMYSIPILLAGNQIITKEKEECYSGE
jgi:hypothetical protein